ncbi:transcriptional regulator [Pseudooceanicola sediminis]|uniref:Transcriptional regulator n=1 Tax=Pseudooceanicola sediminis TaxID=2211117 RepID=A0A399J9F9_9RHOB|nr:helix-turn-helix transcriptional regulator [Puniceibacterium sp. HSS470]RII39286.1 transcriptional regulator [Pseudooceanicola sediminis]
MDHTDVPNTADLPHPACEDLILTQVLFALSDPARLDIVRQLDSGPLEMAQCCLSDPTMPKSTKSHLMKVLREAGVIRNVAKGRGRLLSLRRDDLDARFPGLLASILKVAPEA